jgi:SMC interacting uncharacterized protein involved in chromosome segregation
MTPRLKHRNTGLADDFTLRMGEVTRTRDGDHLARAKAEREMCDFGGELLDSEYEIESLRRELSDVERSLHNKDLDEKTSTHILQLEVGRLKRNLPCHEDELDRVRNGVKDRERVRQESVIPLDKLVNPLSITGTQCSTLGLIMFPPSTIEPRSVDSTCIANPGSTESQRQI